MTDRIGTTSRTQDSSDAGFAALGLAPALLEAVRAQGFTRPTPVQERAIPALLEGRDALASAATGSGKTAAFLLPALQRLAAGRRGATRMLVLAPTRELAAQIDAERQALGRGTRLTGAAVYGGVGMTPQEEAFRKGVDVIVATPGRLLDHLERGSASLDAVEILVLDEADRMLDMGFLPAIRKVLARLPRRARQTLLFSATMPAEIKRLAAELLRDPVRIEVERPAPARGIAQALFPVPQPLKVALLAELLESGVLGNVIVFCRTKHRSNRVAQQLAKRGFTTARIHGNRSQKQRTDALAGFKSGRYRVLVATDIVARGIDVEALDHVVNFDVPAAPDDYIHRVGRTGRAEATGEAFTFVSPDEEPLVRGIEKAVGHRLERRTVEGFDYAARADERLEVPIAERIAGIRAQRARERENARAKAERSERGRTEGRPQRRETGRDGGTRRRRGRGGRRGSGRGGSGRGGSGRGGSSNAA